MTTSKTNIGIFYQACKALKKTNWRFSLFITSENPALIKHFCERYDEELRKSGFFNIIAADPLFSTLPGIYCICIEDTEKNIFVGGGRLHLRLPQVQLPLERVNTTDTNELKKYIVTESEKNLIGELSGFWIDREYSKLYCTDIDLTQITICLALGLSLKLACKKSLCLSSRHVYQHATASGFQVNQKFGEKGKIYYPPKQYSYFMEWENGKLPNDMNSDILQLIYWSRDNLSLSTTGIPTVTTRNLNLEFTS